ncbi:MAG: hypothetical protein ACFFAO_09005 [Candidatus Hermodarchaeota archaeon]
MEDKRWIIVCIIGGLLMLLAGIVGSATFFATVFAIVSKQLGAEAALLLTIILIIFSIVAMGGGISVIIGAILVAKDKIKLGKFIIGLGAGMGLIGLIVFLITSILAGTLISVTLGLINGSYGFIGVILTIFARLKMKKV